MENNKTLTLTESIKSLSGIKDAFFRSGSAENLCLSLKDVLERGLAEYLSNEEVSNLFISIFMGHKTTPKSRSSRFALVSAVRDTGTKSERRRIRGKIVEIFVSHPLIRTDPDLRALLKHIAPVTGYIDNYIDKRKQKLVPV